MYESSSEEEDGGEEVTEGGGPRSSGGLIDVEDMGQLMDKMKSAKTRRLEEEESIRKGVREQREMVTPMLRQALTKQGVRVWVECGCEGVCGVWV